MIGAAGVCSWSLQPESPADLIDKTRACGMGRVQLALEPLRSGAWDPMHAAEAMKQAAIEVMSGMFEPAGEDYTSLESIKRTGGLRPDATWEENQTRARECAEIASGLGLSLVTFHAGFIPHDRDDAERAVMIDRLRRIIDIFADQGVQLGLETGQETAATLEGLLEDVDRESVGVNFDPANMILYGMGDPIEALATLGPRIVQAHLKDATATTTPGQWGTEVPVGSGEVDWLAFGQLLSMLPASIPVVFEREAGDDRIQDICAGVAALSVMHPFRGAFDV